LAVADSGAFDMRDWLIILAIALAIVFAVDALWFSGIYFASITDVLFQIFRRLR
jgi:hypothetical protein